MNSLILSCLCFWTNILHILNKLAYFLHIYCVLSYLWWISCHWDRNMTESLRMKKKKPPRDWQTKWHKWDAQSQYHDTSPAVQRLADRNCKTREQSKLFWWSCWCFWLPLSWSQLTCSSFLWKARTGKKIWNTVLFNFESALKQNLNPIN